MPRGRGFRRGRGGRSRGQQSRNQRTQSPQFSRSWQNAARNQQSPGSQRSPGQRSAGWLSPPSQANRWPSPPIEQEAYFEDDNRSSSSGNDDTSDSEDSPEIIKMCNIDCDCMLCYNLETAPKLKSDRNMQARSTDEIYKSYDQLDRILNEIPLPFVQLWNFTNVIRFKLMDHYSTFMQGYIRNIRSALHLPRDFIEYRLMQTMQRRSKDLDPNMPYFLRITLPDLSESGQGGNDDARVNRRRYVIPGEILQYAYDANNGVYISILGKILAEMMCVQRRSEEEELGAAGGIRDNENIGLDVDRKQFFQDFLNQFDNYGEARRKFLRYNIYTRSRSESQNQGRQGTPVQQQSPRWQRSPRQQPQPRSTLRHQRPDGSVLPPNWITKIPELPAELRYILAMIQDYERGRPLYITERKHSKFKMSGFRNLIYAYILKMLRDHLHVSLKDAAYEEASIREGVEYLIRKAVEVNDLEDRSGTPWRQRLPALDITHRVPNCILELDSFMMGLADSRLDYSYFLASMFCGLQAEARKAEYDAYPLQTEQEVMYRTYMRQCELAEREKRRISRD